MNNSLKPRRISPRMLLVLALVPCTLALTHCRMVSDTVTGVDLSASSHVSSRNHCSKQCQDLAKTAKKVEDKRHKAALRACESNKSCRKEEDRRHRDKLNDIREQERKCKRTCYNEGDVRGGR